MPYDVNGTASVTRQIAVTGQTVLAEQVNVPFADIQSMLSQLVLRSGVAPMTGNLNMNSFKIIGAGTATNPGDLVPFEQVQAGSVPTGAVQAFRRSSAPAGWVEENGSTIGNALSGATRANADTEALFTLLWTDFPSLAIINSNGSAGTRGSSAANDYGAGKRITLFDSRSRFLRGRDGGLGYDATLTVGTAQDDLIKTHTHSGTTSTRANHRHDIPLATDAGTGGLLAFRRVSTPSQTEFNTSFDGEHNHTFTTSSMTGDGAETRPRSSVVLYCIKL